MICKNCGREIEDDSKYCRFCGYSSEDSLMVVPQEENREPEGNKKNINRYLLVGIVALIAIGAMVVITKFGGSPEYKQAKKHLENGCYDLAIEEFTELGNYKESKKLIKKAETAIQDILVENIKDYEKFDFADTAKFKEVELSRDSYKDERDRIWYHRCYTCSIVDGDYTIDYYYDITYLYDEDFVIEVREIEKNKSVSLNVEFTQKIADSILDGILDEMLDDEPKDHNVSYNKMDLSVIKACDEDTYACSYMFTVNIDGVVYFNRCNMFVSYNSETRAWELDEYSAFRDCVEFTALENVNVREDANTDAQKIGMLEKDDVFYAYGYISKNISGDYDWYFNKDQTQFAANDGTWFKMQTNIYIGE